jgi:energy-coupling factor transporter ATP-binding protein EcfA2
MGKQQTVQADVLVLTDDEEVVSAVTEALGEVEGFDFTILVTVPADEVGADSEDGDDEPYTEEELGEMDNDGLKEVMSELDIELDGRFSSKKAIAAILEAQGGDDEEEGEEEEEGDDEDGVDFAALGEAADDEDEDAIAELTELAGEADLDPDDYATWAELAEALSEGDDNEEEDGEEVEEIDEDALNEMGLADLKSLYKEVTSKKIVPKGMKREAIIEAILESAEEE